MWNWLKTSAGKLWDGVLKHLGTVIVAFVFSGGYLIMINKLKEFQKWVREIPTDYILTPFVLLLVTLGVVLRINHKQRMKLSSIEISPENDNEEIKFITHYGVWWKIYLDSEYIEDFPYCPCCEPKQKLVQTAWSPDEKYKCPKTGTEVMLYDSIPWTKEKVLNDLYRAYFSGQHFEEEFLREYHRIKLLSPNAKEEELLCDMFKIEPFNRIPKNEIEKIVQRFKTSIEVMHFIKSHYKSYRNYFKNKADN